MQVRWGAAILERGQEHTGGASTPSAQISANRADGGDARGGVPLRSLRTGRAVRHDVRSRINPGFPVSTRLLCKSLATDLAWHTEIDPTVRRRFMGHRAGDDVFGRIYTLDHPEVLPLVRVAAILDADITTSIGTLLPPTTRPVR
jgi:hypothetical protein